MEKLRVMLMKSTCATVVSLLPTFSVMAFDFAEEELLSLYGDEGMVEIATGYSKPISKAPAVASVITAQTIKKLGITDLDEALETVPGLHVTRNVLGYSPVYTFRGIHSTFNPQVLVLVNGVPITNLFQGDRNLIWGGMPIEAISRIEVIRGPGSAVYGADAFAGVINVITKSPDEVDGATSGVRYGSFNTKDAWALIGGEVGDVKYMAALEIHKTDGQEEKISSDAQSFLDSVLLTSASNAPGPVSLSRENWDARLELAYKKLTLRFGGQVRRDIGNGGGISQALDPINRFGSRRWNTDITYEDDELIKDTRIFIQASYLQTSQEVDENLVLFPSGSTGPFLPPMGVFPDGVIGNPEVYERHSRLNLAFDYSGITSHEIRLGAGYYYGDVYKTEELKNFGIDPSDGMFITPGAGLVDVSDTPFVFLPEGDRDNSYIYLQDAWQLANDWELTAGVRYDDYSDFGGTTNPRLALVWSARHDLTVKALYGEAFRAPSFAETRVSSNPAFLGNPDLDPETLKSYELAFDWRPRADFSLNANLFYYQWEDIIQFVPIGGGASRAENFGEQDGHGLEVEASWAITDNFKLSGNIALQKSTAETPTISSDSDAADAPEKQVYLRADWDIEKDLNLNIQTNWVLDRNRNRDDPRSDIDDYVLVDLTLRRTNLWDNWEVALLVKNLFDEDAREPSPLSRLPNMTPIAFIPDDLPLAGRSVFGEVRYKF